MITEQSTAGWRESLCGIALPLGILALDLSLRWMDLWLLRGPELGTYALSVLTSLLLFRGFEGLLHALRHGGRSVAYRVLLTLGATAGAGNLLITYGYFLANRTMPGLFVFFYVRSEPRQALRMAWDTLGWLEVGAFALLTATIGVCLHFATRLPRRPGTLPWPGKALHAAVVAFLLTHIGSKVWASEQCMVPDVNTLALTGRYLWQEAKGLNALTFRLWPRTPEPVATPLPVPPVNVLIILAESLRPQNLQIYGYGRETTPALAAFQARFPERCLSFRRAYTNATSTLISVPSLLTGRSPLASGRDRCAAPLIWQWGHAAQMATFYISSHGLAWGGLDAFLTSPAPDLFWDKQASGKPAVRDLGIDDHFTVSKALAHLATLGKRPFLGLVHLNTNHYPYNIDRAYRRWDGSSKDLYDDTILELDAHLSRLLTALEAQGRLENTVVILASDHGEAFKEHGTVGHFYSQYAETVSVPLWLYLPPALAAKRAAAIQNLDAPVQNLDVMPTVLDLMGGLEAALATPQGRALEGKSLLRPLPPNRDLLTSNAEEMLQGWGLSLVKGNQHYLLKSSVYPPGEELYDLLRDPQERQNLWPSLPEAERKRLRSRFLTLPYGAKLMGTLFPDTPAPE